MVPVRVHADRAAAVLELEWPDGHVTRYDFETLRWLCPCAYCRGEAGIPGWLDSNPTMTPIQTQLTDLALVGNYALAPTWADGPTPASTRSCGCARTAPALRTRSGASASVPRTASTADLAAWADGPGLIGGTFGHYRRGAFMHHDRARWSPLLDWPVYDRG
jgi:Uncharacterized protein conserved in bacteria